MLLFYTLKESCWLDCHSRVFIKNGKHNKIISTCLLQLLLVSEVFAVSARLLPAVHGPGVEPGIAHAADHLVAVVLQG